MSEFYGSRDDAESIRTIHCALELGITMLDTADMYGSGDNEVLVGKAIAKHRDRAFVATKFGIVRQADNPAQRSISGRPEYVKSACDASLKRLNVDHIDLYYQHRVDPGRPDRRNGRRDEPISFARAKFAFSGFPRPAPQTVRRAQAVHPIAALQNEWSLWSRDLESNGQLEAARELGIGIVAYSPIGAASSPAL